GRDPGGSPRRHLFNAVQIVDVSAARKQLVTIDAALVVVFIPEVAVTAVRANASSLHRQFSRDGNCSLVVGSQHDPSDAIRTALVINERQGPKLTQADEPGPRQEAVTR